ncbi:MAG: hypothetical protein JNK48_06440 [Bryobacterales bacterium]|nr:hypothetical protein [Bryobacterales bacterium]
MKRTLAFLLSAASALAAGPNLTIYNQNFAVVRESIPLDLKQGSNTIQFTNATVHLEPDSVMLRDPSGKIALSILEQNFRAEPISEGLLLNLFEGKELEFEITALAGEKRTIRGKVIRSGYVPHHRAMNRYGGAYAYNQTTYSQGGSTQPIVEVAGKLLFSLPGRPIFPALAADAILKPALDWRIHAERAAKLDAELSYVSGGMSWKADYNMVAGETGDKLDVVGWITMDNQSGKDFENARIKLVAGDVNKIQPGSPEYQEAKLGAMRASMDEAAPRVTERSFDEYHLYTLPLATTLHDRESKQVEFARAANIQSARIYVYDGAKIDRRHFGWDAATIRNQPEYGTQSNSKIWVMREFANTAENGLGIALPRGRVRFYRRDQGGALEFTGENNIGHTPRNEKLRVYTGDAFDIAGERKRVNFQVDHNKSWLDESFEIRLRNRKKEPVEVRVVEHLYRWTNWRLSAQSLPHRKTDSQTAEFLVKLGPDQEQVLTYTVHYTW